MDKKKVLIVEDDIVTGRTLKRVVKELNRYRPASLDAYFTLPIGYSCSGKVPFDFGKVYYIGFSEHKDKDIAEIYGNVKRRAP